MLIPMYVCMYVCIHSFIVKKDCHMQRLIWMCLESWKLDYPTFSYNWTLRACLEVLAGDRKSVV